jgi:hypothetical protein
MLKISHMKRITFLFGILLVAACQSVTEMESKQTGRRPVDYRTLEADMWGWQLARQQAQFEALITHVATQRLVAADDRKAMKLIHRFFPNASHFEQQPFRLEPLASRDSFWLILYEFVGEQRGTNQMYLGSFRKSGFVVDLLEIQPLSSDAQLSLNMLEGDMLKMEYSDYRIRAEYPNQQKDTEPMVRPVAFQQDAAGSHSQAASGTTYFRIHPSGELESVAAPKDKDRFRELPGLSSRIIPVEELEELKPEDLRRMCKALFTSHGLVFKEKLLMNVIAEDGSYDTESIFQQSPLSEVEKTNLDHVLQMDGVLELK